MLIHNADITGSLLVNGTGYNTGSFSGSFTGIVAGTTATASYVEYNSVANKPALVSGSSQITYSGLTGIPSGIVSGSAQVTYSGLTGIPSGIVSGSAQVTYSGLTGVPSGIVSGSSQVTYSGLTGIPSGIVSSSAQISDFGIFATTGSNGFNGSQSITGSLTVTGQVVAQTLNVQQVTSSIVYSSGSNVFGNTLGNTQQFTGSMSVTGSLTVAGTGIFSSNLTTGDILTINSNANTPYLRFRQSDSSKFFIGERSAVSGDGGTGYDIYAVAGNDLRFFAGASKALTIASTGAATFSSTISATGTIRTDGASNGILLRNGFTAEIVNPTNNTRDIQFNQDTNATVMFKGNGNVGIGTTDPLKKLDVYQNSTATVEQYIRNTTINGLLKISGTSEFQVGTETNHPFTIITNNQERLRVTSNGLSFNGDTAAANALDDYEEGTFTPTYTGTNITITTYGNQNGYYTKVGRLVTITVSIMTEAVSVVGSEYVSIGGLPFTSANVTGNENAVVIFDNSRWVSTPPVGGSINSNTTTIQLNSNIGNTGAGQDPTRVLSANMATGAGNRNMVRATATYFTA